MYINNRAGFSAYGYSGLLNYEHRLDPEEAGLWRKQARTAKSWMKQERIWNCERALGKTKQKN